MCWNSLRPACSLAEVRDREEGHVLEGAAHPPRASEQYHRSKGHGGEASRDCAPGATVYAEDPTAWLRESLISASLKSSPAKSKDFERNG